MRGLHIHHVLLLGFQDSEHSTNKLSSCIIPVNNQLDRRSKKIIQFIIIIQPRLQLSKQVGVILVTVGLSRSNRMAKMLADSSNVFAPADPSLSDG